MNYHPNQLQDTPQMQYYSQPLNQSPPSTSNILFVADLPDDTCEEDLSNFFNGYNFFFAKVVHNITRTYAFVHFQTKEDAEKARNDLNGVKITPKYSNSKIAKPTRLCKYETRAYMTQSDEHSNLLVKNLSKEISSHMLYKTFRKFGDIRSSKLMIDYLGNTKGFGFVSFYKVNDAIEAKNELDGKEFGGKIVKVNFLERGRSQQVKKNNIYVKHFPKSNFDKKSLENLFSKFGTIKSAVVLKDEKGESKGFGFVCFEKPEDAEKALNEMNNKKIFDDKEIESNLYVSFAMKKGERQEQLLIKREEMFKQSRKMTVYAKIKDESIIKNEEDFNKKINEYLKEIIGKDYKPKYIKLHFESKNAFITMNTQKEAEDFVKIFQKYSKENNAVLYFNLYKSKIERINASSYFKKYNQFSETTSLASGKQNSKYKVYNNFVVGNQEQEGRRFVEYNNFDSAMQRQQGMNQRVFQKYNNFDTDAKGTQQMIFNVDRNAETSKEQVGDIIYEIVEGLYKDEAGKITGMLLEFEMEKLKSMIFDNQRELLDSINKAHDLIQKNKN